MGRKNLLDLTLDANPLADAPVAQREEKTTTSSSPAMTGLRDTMRHLGENGILDLDPAVIEGSDLQDRLGIDDESIRDLAESIRKHGQQVPVLVRPIPGKLNRFQIVYGRRRLAAVRLLGAGLRIKAVVRTLDDKTAILAQGQENSLRLDPSFIEKAVFIGAMREAGYEHAIIHEALGISRQAIYHYTGVLDALPVEVIAAIGPAHDVGRRRWMELAALGRNEGVDLAAVVTDNSEELEFSSSSEQRFEIVMKNASEALARRATPGTAGKSHRGDSTSDLTLEDGRRIGKVKTGSTEIKMVLSLKEHPEFGQWISKNAARLVRDLHDRWQSESGEKG